jgi:hypothetical protein
MDTLLALPVRHPTGLFQVLHSTRGCAHSSVIFLVWNFFFFFPLFSQEFVGNIRSTE